MKKFLQSLWFSRVWNFLVQQLTAIRVANETVASTNLRIARIAKEEYVFKLLQTPPYRDARHLAHFEKKYFSQSGEDGVIAELLRRTGESSRRFIEIGVGTNLENNSAYLLSQGWKGIWLDCISAEKMAQAAGIARYLDSGALTYISSFLTPGNIRTLLQPRLSSEEVDLFSLDLDRSTYGIWEAIDFMRPRILVLEYNAFYPPPARWIMPSGLDPLDYTTMCFGASLGSFCDLCKSRGYRLVHCGLTGVNAFFVREDLLSDKFNLATDETFLYEPYRSFLLYDHELERAL